MGRDSSLTEKVNSLADSIQEFLNRDNPDCECPCHDKLLEPLLSGAATKPIVLAILKNGGDLRKATAILKGKGKGKNTMNP